MICHFTTFNMLYVWLCGTCGCYQRGKFEVQLFQNVFICTIYLIPFNSGIPFPFRWNSISTSVRNNSVLNVPFLSRYQRMFVESPSIDNFFPIRCRTFSQPIDSKRFKWTQTYKVHHSTASIHSHASEHLGHLLLNYRMRSTIKMCIRWFKWNVNTTHVVNLPFVDINAIQSLAIFFFRLLVDGIVVLFFINMSIRKKAKGLICVCFCASFWRILLLCQHSHFPQGVREILMSTVLAALRSKRKTIS